MNSRSEICKVSPADMQASFDAKTNGNIASGLKQYSEGAVKPFGGYDRATFESRAEVGLEFTEEAQREVLTRVALPLRELAARHGIQVASAGMEDFVPHNTLQIANFPPDVTPTARQEKLDHLGSNYSHLQKVARILTGREIVLDKLVLAGSFMYICTGDITRDQRTQESVYGLQRARKVIEKIYGSDRVNGIHTTDQGQTVVPLAYPQGTGTYYDILHCSVVRITSSASAEQLTHFAQEAYEQIGEPLQQNPIIATVSGVFIGTAYDHAVQRKPNIFSQTNPQQA